MDTLRHALSASLDGPDGDYEIVVSDNHSQDETKQTVAALRSQKIKYVKTPKRLSMRQNFEFGLSHASGDYLLFIGDDDAFMASQWPKLQFLLERDRPRALSWNAPRYFWPGVDENFPGGRLELYKNLFSDTRRKVQTEEIRSAWLNAEPAFPTPNLYHGVFSRDLVESIASAGGGEAFAGAIPDLYASYVAGFLINEFDMSSVPFSISGVSQNSTGMSQMSGQSTQDGSPANRFASESEFDPVTDIVPVRRMYGLTSIAFATLETARGRLRESGIGADIGQLNYGAWFAALLGEISTLPEDQRDEAIATFAAYAGTREKGSLFSELAEKKVHSEEAKSPARTKPLPWYKRQGTKPFSQVRQSRIRFTFGNKPFATVFEASRTLTAILPRDLFVDRTSSKGQLWRTMQMLALREIAAGLWPSEHRASS